MPTESTIQVPLLDLKPQFQPLREQALDAIAEILDSQYMINGPAVAAFEKEVAEYVGCADAVGVSSGSDALIVAMMALGIGPGDEVITTPYSFFATVGGIVRVGATPVFVDIDPVTFNIDVNQLASKVTDKTRAIAPVHLFGQSADMQPILELAKQHDLYVIEDAAQAIGATYHGRQVGTMGDVGCFSFFPTKNLGGAGDAGMVTTQDAELGHRLRVLRNHGMDPKYHHAMLGGNFRIDTIQAAYLSVKLPHLETWSQGRRENAARYDAMLADVELVTTPTIAAGNVSIYNQYIIRAERRDDLRAYLQEHHIGSEIYYPTSLHEQPCFANLGYKRGDFPQSEQAADATVALPIFPELSDEQLDHVGNTIRAFYGLGRFK